MNIQAQDYSINIIFDDSEFTQRNDTGNDDLGEYFFITQTECEEIPVYDFKIDKNGKLNTYIIADNGYPNNVRHTFIVKGKALKPKKIKKPKFGRPKNSITSEELAKSEYIKTDSILKNANTIYLLIEDEKFPNCYLRYKVSQYN